MNNEYTDWEIYTGRLMVSFGDIELLTFKLFEVWLPDKNAHEFKLEKRLDNLIGYVSRQNSINKNIEYIKTILIRIKKLNGIRNQIAHNPVILQKFNDSDYKDVVVDLQKTNGPIPISIESLHEHADKARSLVAKLFILVSHYTGHGVEQLITDSSPSENVEPIKNKKSMSINSLFDESWEHSVKGTKESWVCDVLDDINGVGGVYLETISRWFDELPGTNKSKNHLKVSLKSTINTDHLGAVNELSWWKFLISRGYELEPIHTGKSKTPDFVLKLESTNIYFEVTTLNPSYNLYCKEIKNSQENSLRRIIAKAYEEKREQFKYAHDQESPSVLVLFNYDEWSGFGTQFHTTINSEALFKDILSELSAIILLERFVFRGRLCFKKESMVIVHNPESHFPFPRDIINLIISSYGKDNWIDCENT